MTLKKVGLSLLLLVILALDTQVEAADGFMENCIIIENSSSTHSVISLSLAPSCLLVRNFKCSSASESLLVSIPPQDSPAPYYSLTSKPRASIQVRVENSSFEMGCGLWLRESSSSNPDASELDEEDDGIDTTPPSPIAHVNISVVETQFRNSLLVLEGLTLSSPGDSLRVVDSSFFLGPQTLTLRTMLQEMSDHHSNETFASPKALAGLFSMPVDSHASILFVPVQVGSSDEFGDRFDTPAVELARNSFELVRGVEGSFVSQAQLAKTSQSIATSILGFFCSSHLTCRTPSSWQGPPSAVEGLGSPRREGSILVRQNTFLIKANDISVSTAFYFPPGTALDISNATFQENVFRNLISPNGYSRQVLLNSTAATRTFLMFGLPPPVAELYLTDPSETSLPEFALVAPRTIKIWRNSFWSGETPGVPTSEAQGRGLNTSLVVHTRSIAFMFSFSSVVLTNCSRFIFDENDVNITSFQHSTVFLFTAMPLLWRLDYSGPASIPAKQNLPYPLLAITDSSEFELSHNRVYLNASYPTLHGYGSASFLSMQIFKTFSEPLLRVSENSLLLSLNNTLSAQSNGYVEGVSGSGVMLSLRNGTATVSENSFVSFVNSTILMQCPLGNPDYIFTSPNGSMSNASCPTCRALDPLLYLDCDCWPRPLPHAVNGDPLVSADCTAYRIQSSVTISSASRIQLSDDSVATVDLRSDEEGQLGVKSEKAIHGKITHKATLALFESYIEPSHEVFDSHYARNLDVSNYSSIEVNPKEVHLETVFNPKGISLMHGLTVFTDHALADFGGGPARWRLNGLSSADYVGSNCLFHHREANLQIAGESVVNVFCGNVSVNTSALRYNWPIWMGLEDYHVNHFLPMIIQRHSELNIFVTNVPSHNVETNKELSTEEVESMMPRLEFENLRIDPFTIVSLFNELFIYDNSTFRVFVGSHVVVSNSSFLPGGGFDMRSRLKMRESSKFIVGNSVLEQNLVQGQHQHAGVVRFNGECHVDTGSLFSMTNIRAKGFTLVLNSYALGNGGTDYVNISKGSTFLVANNWYTPVRGSAQPSAILLETQLFVDSRSQFLIWSNTIGSRDVERANLLSSRGSAEDSQLSLSRQSSILIAQNVVAGTLFNTYGKFVIDASSSVLVSENILATNEAPIAAGESTFSLSPSSFFLRCNRRLVNKFELEVLQTLTDYTGGDKNPVSGLPNPLLKLKSAFTLSPCRSSCTSATTTANTTPFCSPLGTPPTSQGTVLDDSYVEVNPEPQSLNYTEFDWVATLGYGSAEDNLLELCTCSNCATAKKDSRFFLSPVDLVSPFCAPSPGIAFRRLNSSELLPSWQKREDPTDLSPEEIRILVAVLVSLGVILVAGGLLGTFMFKRRKKQFSSHLNERLLQQEEAFESALLNAHNLALNQLTEWTVKPTALSFRKGKQIGSGGFGRVFIGLDDASGRLLAAKEINFTDAPKPEKAESLTKREVDLMKRLSHRNVVQYLGADRAAEGEFYIFMEFLPGGSLRSLISEYGRLNQRIAAKYTKQALEGLVYLHEEKVLHRDLKAANMLMDRDGVLKLADMGCAQNFETVQSMRGTPYWMAPECVRIDSSMGAPSDIWSLGCTVLEMLTGGLPFEWLGTSFAVMHAVATGGEKLEEVWARAPHQFKEQELGYKFVRRCCVFHPQDRPSAKELLDDPFLNCEYDDSVLDEARSSASKPNTTGGSRREGQSSARNNESTATVSSLGEAIPLDFSIQRENGPDEVRTGFAAREKTGLVLTDTITGEDYRKGTCLDLDSAGSITGLSSGGTSLINNRPTIKSAQSNEAMDQLLTSLREGILKSSKGQDSLSIKL